MQAMDTPMLEQQHILDLQAVMMELSLADTSSGKLDKIGHGDIPCPF